ncbi:hypothetical protein RFI_40419 [Reticulomyxa filosa]|uniref:Transmembrane protein n=1 Tax=Reticulomyxa filosa TaxID=46433 RepID=X6L7W0_RETFI|nr:hypothetical protein RFI_40419 [Reticulomyxa filosa]|eukprot:ETN97111.1 hypothetical protein RFI_40419 [Reticulomyxa filosa]
MIQSNGKKEHQKQKDRYAYKKDELTKINIFQTFNMHDNRKRKDGKQQQNTSFLIEKRLKWVITANLTKKTRLLLFNISNIFLFEICIGLKQEEASQMRLTRVQHSNKYTAQKFLEKKCRHCFVSFIIIIFPLSMYNNIK